MRPVVLPFEEVFLYTAKSMPFLHIAYIVSWLLIARPRRSVSSAQTLGTQGWSVKTDTHDLEDTNGSEFPTWRPCEAGGCGARAAAILQQSCQGEDEVTTSAVFDLTRGRKGGKSVAFTNNSTDRDL